MHLPLSWDDPSTREAIERYMRVVRDDAPWCPWNIEFIRRINGLDDRPTTVRDIVFDAEYLVLGLGDVYLGAPVAVPVDPRHRLVTTKYNPARTWTPENAVGIGGAYLCIYGMEGPGGYQFVGRTVPVWSTYGRGTPHDRARSRGCCAASTASAGTPWRPTSCSTCRADATAGRLDLAHRRRPLPACRAPRVPRRARAGRSRVPDASAKARSPTSARGGRQSGEFTRGNDRARARHRRPAITTSATSPTARS